MITYFALSVNHSVKSYFSAFNEFANLCILITLKSYFNLSLRKLMRHFAY